MSFQNAMMTADIAARRRSGVMVALVVLVVLLALGSLGIGPVRLSPVTVIDALFCGRRAARQPRRPAGARLARNRAGAAVAGHRDRCLIWRRQRRGAGDRAGDPPAAG